ncbi:hypothetical protein ID866_7636 [Astraeus odoratus]|nr:hypothetical protein ID866_7636 [Astraeus odoratus]
MNYSRIPCQGSPDTPKFSGQPEELTDYLDDITDLYKATRSKEDAQKIKLALNYADPDVKELWSHATGASNGDWEDLILQITHFYPEIDHDHKYSHVSLQDLVEKWSHTPMLSHVSLGKYLHGFECIHCFSHIKSASLQLSKTVSSLKDSIPSSELICFAGCHSWT